MDELKIQDPNCEVREILKTLKQSPVRNELRRKLGGIAQAMNAPNYSDIQLQVVPLGMKEPMAALGELLLEWRTREPENANLGRFVEILEDEELNDFAQLLRTQFDTPNPSVNPTAGSGSSSMKTAADKISRQKSHIKSKLEELMETTQWNASLSAKMTARNILSKYDINQLDSIPNSFDKANKFYEILGTKLSPERVELYDEIIAALEGCRQTGASFALKSISYD